MKRILQPGEGEVLKLGPPAAGEIIIKVDPQEAGSTFAAGTETLLPGAELPVHRHLHQDEVLFIHKGQGRATLESESLTVLPGMMVHVPRQAWHGVRNTGTGLLHFTWCASPPGLEQFFRDLSNLAGSANPAALQELAARHGIEFGPAAESSGAVPPPGGRRRRRRRGGRGRSPGRAPVQATPQGPRPPPAPAMAPAAMQQPAGPVGPAPPSAGEGKRRRRRRGRGRGRSASSPPAATAQLPSAKPKPPAARPPQSAGGRPPKPYGGRPPRRERHRLGSHRVKEVYMGGQWIRVEGEGPVISPGPKRPGQRQRPKPEEPSGPLSVSL